MRSSRAPALSLAEKLRHIHAGISALISRLDPDALAVEDVFHAANTRTALVLGHVRGVVLLAGAQAGLSVHEYPPATVKQQVTGSGRAEKSQVAFMVTRMLALTAEAQAGDATDALAVALCFACVDARSALGRGRAPAPRHGAAGVIAQLRGRLVRKDPQEAVVDVAGVGYRVTIPLSTFYRLAEIGADVSLLTHTHVREDTLALFGFLTAAEQALFERLIAVSGRRPEAGDLDPLRHRSPRSRGRAEGERRRAPDADPRRRQEDGRAARAGAQGQGAGPRGRRPGGARASRRSSAQDDLVSALVHLGYSRPEAERGVERALKDGDGRFEDLLRRSLRILSGR